MAEVALIAAGGAQAIKAYKTRKFKDAEAEGYRDARNRRMAAATREMQEEERRKEFMHSRAIALAAASGAGVDDPTMVKLLGDLNAEGEYRVMSKLWAGQDDAAGLQFRAEAAEREGDTAIELAPLNIVTSALSAYGAAGGFK